MLNLKNEINTPIRNPKCGEDRFAGFEKSPLTRHPTASQYEKTASCVSNEQNNERREEDHKHGIQALISLGALPAFFASHQRQDNNAYTDEITNPHLGGGPGSDFRVSSQVTEIPHQLLVSPA